MAIKLSFCVYLIHRYPRGRVQPRPSSGEKCTKLLRLTALTLVLVTIALPASAQAAERVSAVLEAIKAARSTTLHDRVWM